MDGMGREHDALGMGAGWGLLQFAVLHHLDTPCAASALTQRLCGAGVRVDAATLRTTLHGMAREGWVSGQPAASRGDSHETYAITAEGRRMRATLAETWRGTREVLDALLSDDDVALAAPPAVAEESECAMLAAERQELERQRSDLLSTVSHELRTPLTLIRTSIGLLLDSDPDAVMRERLLRNIKQSADRMHVLVTDLLDLVRLRSGRADLQLRYVDLGELVAGVAALMRPLLDQKGQALEVAVPVPAPRVMCDHRRLEQVLLNLLSNANKFAPRGAQVRVTLVEHEHLATVAVTDTGPGISPEAQARLFEQFYTTRTSSPSHNIGVGLGLPIAKGIVEAHGGRIWVESAVGRGSTFSISVPKEGPGKEGTGEDTGGG